MKLISIVIPCHNEETVLPLFYKTLQTVSRQLPAETELIFVDDGSRDKTLPLLKSYAAQSPFVHYLSFTRNFGKEAAMLAGMRYSHGDYIAIMDADLQDPPSLLLSMYEMIQSSDCDCVAARRVTRQNEPPVRSLFSSLFYRIFNALSSVTLKEGERDFRLMNRRMADAVLSLGESCRFSKGIFSYVGFSTKWLEYPNVSRASGKSQWSFMGLFRYAAEGIASFSTCLLSLPFLLAALTFCLSLASGLILLIRSGSGHFSSVLALSCLILFLSSFLFASLGTIGYYLGRIFLELKRRPLYLIRETNMDSAPGQTHA